MGGGGQRWDDDGDDTKCSRARRPSRSTKGRERAPSRAPDFAGGARRAPRSSSSFVVDSSSVTAIDYNHPVAYAEPLLEAHPGVSVISAPVARPVSPGLDYRTAGPRSRTLRRAARGRTPQDTRCFCCASVGLRDARRHSPVFCHAVTVACAVIFVLEMNAADMTFAPFHDNPLYGPPVDVLIRCGAKLDCLIEDYGENWRVFSPMWLHAGVIHLACNVAAVQQLGVPLEREFGWRKIGPLYFFGGIMGTLFSILFLPNSIMVGASGAVFALLGANWADWLLHNRKCNPFLSLLIVTVFNLALGLTPLLDNFAHTGGLIAGVLWGLVYLREDNTSCMSSCLGFAAPCCLLGHFGGIGCCDVQGALDVFCPECTAWLHSHPVGLQGKRCMARASRVVSRDRR